MWQTDYHSRLADWAALRQECNHLPLQQQLATVNDWWFQAPIVNRSIRWNESAFWPDPWELLTNSGYCDLARALGIVYTLTMLESTQYKTVEIAETDQDNLVLVDSGKYILNWAPGEILNIHSKTIKVSQRIDSGALVSFKS
jgi:hypothetical protein